MSSLPTPPDGAFSFDELVRRAFATGTPVGDVCLRIEAAVSVGVIEPAGLDADRAGLRLFRVGRLTTL